MLTYSDTEVGFESCYQNEVSTYSLEELVVIDVDINIARKLPCWLMVEKYQISCLSIVELVDLRMVFLTVIFCSKRVILVLMGGHSVKDVNVTVSSTKAVQDCILRVMIPWLTMDVGWLLRYRL